MSQLKKLKKLDKIIHQIWVGPLPMPLDVRYYIKHIKESNPLIEHRLWTDHNLPTLPNEIKLVYDKFGEKKHYASQADVLRVFLIKEYGGLYLDADFDQIGPLDDLFDYDNFFCEWNDTLLTGVFGAKAGNELIEYACKQISLETDWYGPSWLNKVIDRHDINVMRLEEFESKYAQHHALGSWLTKEEINKPTI